MTENSQGLKNSSKYDNTSSETKSENIYLFSILNEPINNCKYSSHEEIKVEVVRNISSNHPRNNRIYSQNLIMHNYSTLLSLSTNEKTTNNSF